MFYQTHTSLSANGVKLENGIDFSFPMHLHSSFELIVVTEGEMSVIVDGKEYILVQEEALLIFPNQVHELKTEEHSCHFLCIFSSKLVQAYNKCFLSKVPVCNKFHPDFFFVEMLASLKNTDNIMKVKGILYCLCGKFDETAEYVENNKGDDDLLSKIFRFVELNFNGNCSLAALSKNTSYHYVYLSKFFKQCTGISFTDYVNRYRISEGCYILQNSDQTILQTAYDCGFDSLRSFNRNFKSIMGVTPSEFKNKL